MGKNDFKFTAKNITQYLANVFLTKSICVLLITATGQAMSVTCWWLLKT